MGFTITIKVDEEFEAMEYKRDKNRMIKDNLTKQLIALVSIDSHVLCIDPRQSPQKTIVDTVEDIVDNLADAIVNIMIAEAAIAATENLDMLN